MNHMRLLIITAVIAFTFLSAVVKPTLYLTNGSSTSGSLSVFDLSDPLNPQFLSNLDAGGTNSVSLVINPQGNTLYITNRGTNTISIFDITDPQFPLLKGKIDVTIYSGNLPVSIDINTPGNALYIACLSSKNVLVYDISNPFVPIFATTIPFLNTPEALIVNRTKNTLYVGVLSDIYAYDISTTPLNPISAGMASNLPNMHMGNLQVDPLGKVLYVTNRNANATISIFDLKNSLYPDPINTALLTGGSISLGMSMNFPRGLLYVTNNGSADISIFDITVPLSPSLIAIVSSADSVKPRGVIAYSQKNAFYVANNGGTDFDVFNDTSNFIRSIPSQGGSGNNPAYFAIFVPAPLIPPGQVKKCTREDRFLSQSVFSERLSWEPSPSSAVVGYRIYRNDALIATVSSQVHCYEDHSACGLSYAVSAIDGTGRESQRISVQSCSN